MKKIYLKPKMAVVLLCDRNNLLTGSIRGGGGDQFQDIGYGGVDKDGSYLPE